MKSKFEEHLLRRVRSCRVIAVLVIEEVRHAVPVARALLEGGIDVMEITLRTPVALEALRIVRGAVPEMIAGVGTILCADDVNNVVDAGGQFGVAPGTNSDTIQAANEMNLPFAPGVAIPSDVEVALRLGCREMKFFPAEPSGGIAYLQSMAAPYSHLGVRFIPLGGVNSTNMKSYLKDPSILAVGGSWIAPRQLISAEDWGSISGNAREAARIAASVVGK